MYRLLLCLALATAACAAHSSPQLRVLGVHDASAREVVFVQVTNPAATPMRLTKLEYTFAAAGTTVSAGELAIERDVAAGSTIVVEVPLEGSSTKPMMLKGTLIAELDQMVREFQVSAQIQPH
jgi:LEA14-like dessication related protein